MKRNFFSDGRMTALAVTAAIVVAALLWAVAFSVGRAEEKSERVSESVQRLALEDFAEACGQMKSALLQGEMPALLRAVGRAEAYLSRAGLEECEGIYSLLGRICDGAAGGACAVDPVLALADAAEAALHGDGGEALRRLAKSVNDPDENAVRNSGKKEDTSSLQYRVLKKLGRGSDDIAKNSAKGFACPNAVLDFCTSSCSFPPCFKLSGENVFIELTSDGRRVLLYCFDRDCDPTLGTVSEDVARETARRALTDEMLSHTFNVDNISPTLDGGVYRFVFCGEGKYSHTALITAEVYRDTGRLRKFDAMNYYRIKGN